jgi:hypothetical protein
MVRNQEKKLQIEAQQLSLQAQQDKHSFEFAKESLAAKSAGQGQKQKHETVILLIKTAGLLLFSVLVCALIVFAMWSGHEAAAMEIVKALLYLSGGFAGGFGYAKTKKGTADD